MAKSSKLVEKMFKIGFSVDPLFMDEYGILLYDRDVTQYQESIDMFILNSKVKNGKNLYKEFQKKYCFNMFDKDVLKNYKEYIIPVVGTEVFEGKVRLVFLTNPQVLFFAEKNNLHYDEEDYRISDVYNDLFKTLDDKIIKCDDIIKNREKSKYYKDSINELGLSESTLGDASEVLRNPLIISSAYSKLKNEYVSDRKFIENLYRIEKNDLDYKEFFDCFDIDKYFLMYSKIVLDLAKEFKEEKDIFLDLVPQVYNYVHFVEELGLNDYNPKIQYVKDNKNKKKPKVLTYTFQDLKRNLNKFLESIPDCTFKYVSAYDPYLDKDIKDMGTREDIEKEVVKYRYGEDYQNITASWRFIKKGEVEKTYSSYKTKTTNSERKEREAIDVEYRMSTFRKTNYLCQIIGTDKFTGYIGYIYPNGIIAFEKFFDEKDRPSKDNNATYIMNVKNFEYFSSLTKPEIIEYIKDMGNEEIDRKYHSSNWEKNLRKIVENPNYDEEMKERVNAIITEGRKAKKLEV